MEYTDTPSIGLLDKGHERKANILENTHMNFVTKNIYFLLLKSHR